MELKHENFNWYGFKLDKAAERLGKNVKYLGTFCVRGQYKPSAVFYSPTPDLEKGHKPYPYFVIVDGTMYVAGMTAEEMEKERYQDGVYCKKCDDLIYSVMRHDFRECKCGDLFIDGGKEYTRFGYNNDSEYQFVKIDFLTGNLKEIGKLQDKIDKETAQEETKDK